MTYDSGSMGSFAPGSNLKDNWDGTIKEVTFEKQDQGQNYAAHLLMDADDGEEVEMFAGLGTDWMSYDGGRTAEHPRGVGRRFNGQTAWSKLLVRMFDCCFKKEGAENEMVRRDREHGGRAAQIGVAFQGLRFHWDVEKVAERRPQDTVEKKADGSEERKREWVEVEVDRMLPTGYLGVADGQVAMPQPTPQPITPNVSNAPQVIHPQQQSQPMPQPQDAHPAIANLPQKDQVQVRILAKSQDFSGFVDGVMGLTLSDGRSMLEVPEVIQALSDENFYLTLRG